PLPYPSPVACLTSSASSFLFPDTAPSALYTLSLHDALPIYIDTGIDQAVSAAGDLARRTGATVAITGGSDVVTDGEHVLCVEGGDRKSTRLNSSHVSISYAVFCLKKKKH